MVRGGSKKWRQGQPLRGRKARSLPYTECPYHHKRTWRSRAKADDVAEQMARQERDDDEPVRVHWCPLAGGWHVTSTTQAEFDRKQTLHYAQRDEGEEDDGACSDR
jgi:hypothetical protein